MSYIKGFPRAGSLLTKASPLPWPGWFYLPSIDAWAPLERAVGADFMIQVGYTRYSAHRPDSVSGGGRQGILTPTPVDLERENKRLSEGLSRANLLNESQALQLVESGKRLGEQAGDIANLQMELESTKMMLETATNKLAAIIGIIRPDPKALTDEQQPPGTKRRTTSRASRATGQIIGGKVG